MYSRLPCVAHFVLVSFREIQIQITTAEVRANITVMMKSNMDLIRQISFREQTLHTNYLQLETKPILAFYITVI